MRLFVPVEAFAEVTVAGSLFVDRAFEIEKVYDAARGEVVAGDDFWGAINDNGGFEWFSFAYGVSEADEDFVGSAFF